MSLVFYTYSISMKIIRHKITRQKYNKIIRQKITREKNRLRRKTDVGITE